MKASVIKPYSNGGPSQLYPFIFPRLPFTSSPESREQGNRTKLPKVTVQLISIAALWYGLV